MDKHVTRAQGADTASSILASAFGEKYYGWISLPSDSRPRPLTVQEKKKLKELIADRDHYEIKQTIVKLKIPKTEQASP